MQKTIIGLGLATGLVAGCLLAGLPGRVARQANASARQAAQQDQQAWPYHRYIAWHDRGWKVWMENPGFQPGTTRLEIRAMDPGHPEVTDPLPIGGGELEIGGQTWPFQWDGAVFHLDVPDSLLALGRGQVTVWDVSGVYRWQVVLQ